MTSCLRNYRKVLFFCFAATLLFTSSAGALDKKTSFALSHYIMGVMYEDLGDLDKAIQEYKHALKADSKNVSIHLGLASSYIKKKEILQAIEEVKITAGIEPEAVEPHAILALLYATQNKADLAAKEYETALKNASRIEPKNIDIYKSLGALYLEQRRFKEAQDAYRLVLDLAPNDSEAHFYLANVYDELKDRDAAVKELKKALGLKPDYHEALNYLGYLYVEENKNLAQAEVMIKKALEMQPDNGAYIDSLGWFYFKKGKFKEAAKELERASVLMEDKVIYDHLGDVYFKISDLEKAKASWEKSLKLDPAQNEVKAKLEKCNIQTAR